MTHDDFGVWDDAATAARDQYLRSELTAETVIKITKVNDWAHSQNMQIIKSYCLHILPYKLQFIRGIHNERCQRNN